MTSKVDRRASRALVDRFGLRPRLVDGVRAAPLALSVSATLRFQRLAYAGLIAEPPETRLPPANLDAALRAVVARHRRGDDRPPRQRVRGRVSDRRIDLR